jgi:YegS/Rv2252/BmrU family lipid kinase
VERASIVFNPAARNAPARQRLLAAAAAMKPLGWDIDVRETEAAGHGASLAREAAVAGSRVVFACGGDGTLNEVVNGLLGTPAAAAVIRGGTGNVFGKEVRVPRRIEDALSALTGGQEYRFDIAYAEGEGVERIPNSTSSREDAASNRRYFLLMCGIGFDAAVVRNVPARPKRLLGTTSYLIWGAAEALRFRARRASISLDGRRLDSDLYWGLLGNTRSYGGVTDIARHAVADDGLLEAYLFEGSGWLSLLKIGARVALRRHQGATGVTYARARQIEVETPGIPVQADGEYFGQTPMRFGIKERALSVLLLPGSADDLIGRGSLRDQPA